MPPQTPPPPGAVPVASSLRPAPPGDGARPSVLTRAGELTTVEVCERPCAPCPWRRDNAARYRYANLREYLAGTIPGESDFRDLSADDGPLLFVCHATTRRTAAQRLCAGWLAVVGADHPTIRLGVALDMLDPAALRPGDDWPSLWETAAEMLAAVGPDAPAPAGMNLEVHP